MVIYDKRIHYMHTINLTVHILHHIFHPKFFVKGAFVLSPCSANDSIMRYTN